MIEDKLELVLITFNRYKYLENTLSQITKSPFKNCKITILDNCSTDKTPEVCSKYKELFSNIHVIRHRENIGGGANILRAIETSSSMYTWIVCDDDNYDFSECDDIIESIKSEKNDIILFYSLEYQDKNGRPINELLKAKNKDNNSYLETSGKELFDLLGHYYFLIMSFTPAYIFKTEIYDSECLIKGYFGILNMYPHFQFMVKTVEDNLSIYKSKKDMIIRGDENPTFSILKWTVSWLELSSTVNDEKIKKVITDKYIFNYSLIYLVIYGIIQSKANNEKNFKNQSISLMSSILKAKGIKKGILFSIVIIILSILPKRICRYANNVIENKKSSVKEKSSKENKN